jgi:hypothetical protein
MRTKEGPLGEFQSGQSMAKRASESVRKRDGHPKNVLAVSRAATGYKIAAPRAQFINMVNVFVRPTVFTVDGFFSAG